MVHGTYVVIGQTLDLFRTLDQKKVLLKAQIKVKEKVYKLACFFSLECCNCNHQSHCKQVVRFIDFNESDMVLLFCSVDMVYKLYPLCKDSDTELNVRLTE